MVYTQNRGRCLNTYYSAPNTLCLLHDNGEGTACINKQNHQYCYVMKRAANAPLPKPKTTKNKAKHHSKSKDKKFSPLEYLNSLIEQIHDDRFDTVRKRPPSSLRMERSSAMAFTTPITERTVSSSKVRSKSSYSQYRKRSVPMREILRVDLENAITEEDNIIHFTEETVQSISEVSRSPHSQVQSLLTPAAAARRIQRAWRKYQTLKVVKKYYEHYKNVMRKEQEEREQELRQRSERKEGKRELQRTLKIKKNSERVNLGRTIRASIGEVVQRLEFSDGSNNTTKELLREPGPSLDQTKTVELPSIGQQIYQSQEYTSKDLNFVIGLFRSKEENASRQIDSQLNAFCKLQAELTPLEYFTSNQSDLSSPLQEDQLNDGLSPAIFTEMERTIKEKCELLKQRMRQRRQSEAVEEECRQREEQLQGRMMRELRNIQRCREDYMRSIRQLKENMIKLQADSSKIEKIEAGMGRSGARVRKCYSADTLILKSIIQEVTFKQMDIDCKQSRQPQLLLEDTFKREDKQLREEGMYPICPTSPPSGLAPNNNSQTGCSKGSLACYEFSDSDRLHQQIYNDSSCSYNPSQLTEQKRRSVNDFQEELVNMSNCGSESSIQASLREDSFHSEVKEDANTALLKECAEDMQERIESVLVAEIVEEIYTSHKMYTVFKPYVQKPFQFKQITDFDIFGFLEDELPQFFLSPTETLARFNQKINPNSLEILRLIRDFDFQIDEYQLVFPQEIFKAYRRTVEESYSSKIKQQSQSRPLIPALLPSPVIRFVEERALQRRSKRAKFLSFQRDLKIMYMKSVFNCFNQLVIQTKSFYTFMNSRSSIGPGELTLALREYNTECRQQECASIIQQARERAERLIREKCMLPVFKTYKQLQTFQKQMTKQISSQLAQTQYKWVNYMDEVLEIWQELSSHIADALIDQAASELFFLCG